MLDWRSGPPAPTPCNANDHQSLLALGSLSCHRGRHPLLGDDGGLLVRWKRKPFLLVATGILAAVSATFVGPTRLGRHFSLVRFLQGTARASLTMSHLSLAAELPPTGGPHGRGFRGTWSPSLALPNPLRGTPLALDRAPPGRRTWALAIYRRATLGGASLGVSGFGWLAGGVGDRLGCGLAPGVLLFCRQR